MVQWLQNLLSNTDAAVQPLVRELRSHMPQGQKKQNIKQKQYATDSIKTLKMAHIKKKKKTLRKKNGFRSKNIQRILIQILDILPTIEKMQTGERHKSVPLVESTPNL